MPNLVPVPWQPHLSLTPHTLSYLTAASRKVGHDLYLYDREYTVISPAWRSFAQQLRAWLRGLAGTGPKASSPYTGQRNHMRGAAFDLRDTSATVQAACRSVGLVRDSQESWHWNDPLAASMPIIYTNTTTTSTGTASLLDSTEENDMLFIRTYEKAGYLAGEPATVSPTKRWYTADEKTRTVRRVPTGQEGSFKILYGSAKQATNTTIARLEAQWARHDSGN